MICRGFRGGRSVHGVEGFAGFRHCDISPQRNMSPQFLEVVP